jgi:hypothetical protein
MHRNIPAEGTARPNDQKPRRRQAGRVASILAALATGLLSVTLLNAGAAGATTNPPTVNATSPLTFCPGTTALCKASEGTVAARTTVSMVCWENPPSDPSHRYFYIQASGGREGFVHAGVVSYQARTPACSTVPWIDAANWALGQDGQSKVPANAKNGNVVVYWSDWCWLFTQDAWRLGAGHTSRYSGATAQDTYVLYARHNLVHALASFPPRGSLVFFSYGTIGHVAISLGDGWIETTRGTAEQTLTVTHMTMTQQGLAQLGYVAPGNV